MKRYKKFVLEAEKGITFEILRGTNGDLIIRALNDAIAKSESESEYNVNLPESDESKHLCEKSENVKTKVGTKNYEKPPIPDGYKYVCGKWYNGFVMERCSDGSQFVWIPVGWLDPNGTLDGEHFSEKFGRRNYGNDKFSEDEYHEDLDDELLEQLESVKKYGGFYFSCHNISKSPTGKPQSVKGVMPLGYINCDDAQNCALTMENNGAVKSHLVFGAEYDSVLEWLIKSGAKTLDEIANDSTKWGNYENAKDSSWKLLKTGSIEEWCTNNIYDLAGNMAEWTQEQKGSSKRVIRGGSYDASGKNSPVSHRYRSNPCYSYKDTGFRVALCIK